MMRIVSRRSLSAGLLLFAGSLFAAEPSESDQLVRELKSDKPGSRAHAASELAKLGPRAAATVPALINALQDESLAVRVEAQLALEHIGPAARTAVPELILCLNNKEDRGHLGAVNALGAIGPDSLEAAPRISEFLTATDERISVAAAFALARILPADAKELQPAIKILIAAVESHHKSIRHEAIRGLVLAGRSAVPELAELVGDFENKPHSAVAAAGVLRLLGSAAEPAMPALLLALSSSHDLVVTSAADAIGAIGPKAKSAVPRFTVLLQSKLPLLRTHAAHNLGQLGVEAKSVAGELTNALGDQDFNVRREAAQALGKIGPAAKSAIVELTKTLQDDSQPVVLAAAHALVRIGSDAVPALISLVKTKQSAHWAVVILAELGELSAPAVPTLRTALGDADEELSQAIIHALGQIGPAANDSASDLIKLLEDEKGTQRIPAVFALGNIRAVEAIPCLNELVQDKNAKDPQLALVAAGALVLIEKPVGKNVQLALPRLIAALQDDSEAIRREAATALRQIGPPATAAIPALIQGLKDPNPTIGIDFLWALTAIVTAETAPKVIDEYLAMLATAEPRVKYTACYAAGSLGVAAVEAIPILEANLQDPDTFLQVASAWALVRISPENPQIAEECLDPLVRGLGVSDPSVRAEAATSLGRLGLLAKRAAPALKQIRNDTDETVRNAAIQAFELIQRPTSSSPRR